jgi:hypothetical protein
VGLTNTNPQPQTRVPSLCFLVWFVFFGFFFRNKNRERKGGGDSSLDRHTDRETRFTTQTKQKVRGGVGHWASKGNHICLDQSEKGELIPFVIIEVYNRRLKNNLSLPPPLSLI